MLRLRSSARKRFDPWLEEHFPKYAPAYRRFFGGAQSDRLRYADGSRLGATYSEGVLERFARLRAHHGRPDRPPSSAAPTPAPPREQLALGWEWE